jgi:hypothetical protein
MTGRCAKNAIYPYAIDFTGAGLKGVCGHGVLPVVAGARLCG